MIEIKFQCYQADHGYINPDACLTRPSRNLTTMLASTLTSEARIMRCLLCKYVVSKIHEGDLCIPHNLVSVVDQDMVTQDLEYAFGRAVNMFVHENGTALCSTLNTLPSSASSIEETIAEAARVVLLADNVSWGHMVAVSALIMEVAVRCVRSELSEVVIPLLNHITLFADQKLCFYIRENGGWATFAHVFRNTNKAHGWLHTSVTSIVNRFKSYF